MRGVAYDPPEPTMAAQLEQQDVLNLPTNLFIGGAWREASDHGRFDVTDPATERVDEGRRLLVVKA